MPRDLSDLIEPVANTPAQDFATITEDNDAGDDTNTTASMTVGDEFEGLIVAGGDEDWVRIELTAGRDYSFLVLGGEDAVIFDPALELRDSNGDLIQTDDNDGPGLNSVITFTATSTDTYFLNVRGATPDFGGNYVLSAHFDTWGTEEEIGTRIGGGSNGFTPRAVDVSNSNPEIEVDLTGLDNRGQRLAEWALEAWSEVTGITFRQVTNGVQMRIAEELLLETDLPVSTIAERVGYTDTFNFSRAYLKATGRRPSENRLQN